MSDNEHIRTKLVKLVQSAMSPDVPYEERMKYVMFVSIKDSILYEEAIERGENGESLRELYTTEGLIWVHPLFYGHIVFWYAPETKFCHVKELSHNELLALLAKQQEYIKVSYNKRIIVKAPIV